VQPFINKGFKYTRRSNTHGEARLVKVRHLQAQCDDVKLLLQLAKELKMFASFSQFQILSELAVSIGKQVGQWQRKLSIEKQSKPIGRSGARVESL